MVEKRALPEVRELLEAGDLPALASPPPHDDHTKLLRTPSPTPASEVFTNLDPAGRASAHHLLQHEPDPVGHLKTPDVLALGRDRTIRHVLAVGPDRETLNGRFAVESCIRNVLLAPFVNTLDNVTGIIIDLSAAHTLLRGTLP